MKKKILGILVCMLMIAATAFPVAGNIENSQIKVESNRNSVIIQPPEEWNKTYGGSDGDRGECVQQTSDGGYMIAGETLSYGAGESDILLIKTNSSGNEQWNKTYGGTDWDYVGSAQQTTDGGYAMFGYTLSYGVNFWLIKTDADGTELWSKTYSLGGSTDSAKSGQQTSDGGYIMAGVTYNTGSGAGDFWLVKTDADGNMEWDKVFGGPYYEDAYSVKQTTDGGYIISGLTESYGSGNYDVWLIKTDADGNMEWNKTFGGPYVEAGQSVQQTTDGGYIIGGYTYGYIYGYALLIKTDEYGNEEWNKTFVGLDSANCESVQQTTDNGYILGGSTAAYGTWSDAWLTKTDSNGNKQWNTTFGGPYVEAGYSVQQTTDGGYIFTGCKGWYDEGDGDVWLIKLESEGNQPPTAPEIDGPPQGVPGTEYCWTFHSYDDDGDMVRYYIDWGDGSSEVTDWHPACTPVEVCHTYTDKGTYVIAANTEDETGLVGPTSTFTVVMPRYRALQLPLLQQLFEQFPNAFPILRQLLGL